MRLFAERNFLFKRPRRALTSVVLVLLVFTGCKTPDFIGRRYDNFTAYYNTFYNAERVFETGYDNLSRTSQPIDRLHFLPLFPRTTGAGSRDFENAVLKSANLLREHPDSKWVDDALLLIGKSYYFQENFVGATQKFREVAELGSELESEGRFWLARALTTSGAYEEAEEELSLASLGEDVPRKWLSQFGLLLGELKVKQQAWQEAADFLESSIPQVKDKELAGRSQFLLGQVLEQIGEYASSVEAFERVSRFTPSYELDYAARYSAVRIEGRYLDPQRALSQLKRMERDDKNFSNLSELQLLKARIWQDNGRDTDAFDLYDRLLYEPTSVGGSSASTLAGRIHYALGELYRDIDEDFVMASAHFDSAAGRISSSGTARTRMGGSSSTSASGLQYAPEAITDADDLKVSFSQFARIFKDLARYDSLLWLGKLPDAEFDEKILEFRKLRAEELAEQQRELEERQREQAFRNTGGAADQFQNRGLPEGKIVPGVNDLEGSVDGFLFHKSPVRIQENLLAFQDVWGERPLAPNWRRIAALSNISNNDSRESDTELENELEQFSQDILPEIDVSAIPRDSTKQVEMESMRAISRYEIGNTLFLAMALPDSAAVWYRMVIDDDEEEPVAQRALYALAEVHRALGDSVSSNLLYEDIIERFPESDFSAEVRERLGMDPIEVAITDSSQLAIMDYEAAYSSLSVDNREEGINRLLAVAVDWQEYDESLRAILAAADLHMQWAGSDSLAIFSEIPMTLDTERLSQLWPDKFGFTEEAVQDTSAILELNPGQLELVPPDSSLVESIMDLAVASDSLSVSENADSLPADSISATRAEVPDSSGVDISLLDGAEINADEATSAEAPSEAVLDPDPQEAEMAMEESAVTDSVQVILSEFREPFFVEDLYQKLVDDHFSTRFGLVANRTLKALVEMRTPPVDTSEVASDSLDLALSIPDSTAGALLSASDSTLTADELAPTDSLLVDAQVDSLRTDFLKKFDREVVAAQSPGQAGGAQSDSTDVPKFAIPEKEISVVENTVLASEPVQAPLPTPEEYEEEEEGEEVRRSSNLKPLLPTGRPDEDAVGWTIMLGNHLRMQDAQIQLRDLRTRLDSTNIPLYLLTNATGERFEFIVGWGLFETRAERDEAQMKFDAILPQQRNYLHLIPTTSRRP